MAVTSAPEDRTDHNIHSVTPWHEMAPDAAAQLLGVSLETGLGAEAAAQRLQEYGANVLAAVRGRSALKRFLLQLHQPLIYILLAAAAVTAALSEWVDSAVILAVVLVNATVGHLQEAKAIDAIALLSRSLARTAGVIRGGDLKEVDASEIVPGDVLVLRAGDEVPADARVIASAELRIAEAALTGESLPVEKAAAPLPAETPLADRSNMVYSSTLVTNGSGRAVVTATGNATEIGKISRLVSEAEVLDTPLTRRVNRFSHFLLVAILLMAGLTVLFGVWKGQPLVDMFMASVALAVGAIPEGLPAALTITLAIGVSRMAARKAVIRKLPAVETLGSTSVICSDKTGTLTQNEMTVTRVWAGGEEYSVSGAGYEPEGRIHRGEAAVRLDESAALEACIRAGYLCNESRHVESEGRWTIVGDPTEGAMIVLARKASAPVAEWARAYPRRADLPFASEHKYMATLHDAPGGKRVTCLKGAVERVLERCTGLLGPDGQNRALDAEMIRHEAESMATHGLRVLAVAERLEEADVSSLDRRELETGFQFLGLYGMIDPPRPEAIAAVRACKAAGIQVKMITGDHVVTASAVAEQIGILDRAEDKEHANAVTGRELESAPFAELGAIAERTSVFARVTPEQKLQLVEALQANGHVVAMTGDGVNDAPALRRADIGVAMGMTGTEVSKEAADMVLTDDNFATLRDAVEEGRGIYDNIVKFLVWTLPTNLGEGLVILAAIAAQTALPILPVQILWINMTTAILLGLTLAFEPREPGLMERMPRSRNTAIVPYEFVWRMILVGILLLAGAFGMFWWEVEQGASEAYARTVALNVFVVVQTFYLFNCRSLTRPVFAIGLGTNKVAIAGAAIMIGLQLAITYIPAMNRIFGTEPIAASEWGVACVAGGVAYTCVELEKWLRRTRGGYSAEWTPRQEQPAGN